MQFVRKISPFSVILLMTVAAVVGLACLSMLKVQYAPVASGRTASVTFSYPEASARTVEAEVTSVLEGVFSTLKSTSGIHSVSNDGGGYIEIDFDRHADMQSARLEISSLIRNTYPNLPQGCSYPSVSLNGSDGSSKTAVSYSIRSTLPTLKIAEFVENSLLHPLSSIEGVSSVDFYGQTPFEWVVTFGADRAAAYGLSAADIRRAICDYYSEDIAGMSENEDQTYAVKLKSDSRKGMESIPIANAGGRIIRLGDIASFRYQESMPGSYYRVNGLNVLNLTVEASSDANIITVVRSVRDRLGSMKAYIPDEIGISVCYDNSAYISDELHKIFVRTALCLILLLLCTFLASRSRRYTAAVAVTLGVSLCVAFACYHIVGLHIHIYTLAGITVSLGIIIDNSIVMIDHYVRTGNRSVFPAMLSAVLTTVAALLAVFLLPESEKADLTDFCIVIIINLSVSLLTSYLFVPALLTVFVYDAEDGRKSVGQMRRMARWNRVYERYIDWGTRHRWVLSVIFIASFGLPFCFIPEDSAIGRWRPYAENRSRIDDMLGSSSALFNKALSRSDFYREPARQQLSIRAGMPEGSTIHQLNDVMKSMENYLARFDEIDVFETRISSYDNGIISVLFRPEYENTRVPAKVKSDVIAMARNFGGANWTVSGIDDSFFNNNIVTESRNQYITLKGYNYDELIHCGEVLMEKLSENRRVTDAIIWGSSRNSRPLTEFNLSYRFESLGLSGISPYDYYAAVQSPLYSSSLIRVPYDGRYVDLRLESSAKEDFDVWHMNNLAVDMNGSKAKLSDVGEIVKRKTGLPVEREDQSYIINVRYNFLGSFQFGDKVRKDAVSYMNTTVLPVGYVAIDEEGGWFNSHRERYAGLILLVVLLIFVICSVQFNSLRQSLSIISLIPISFIGVFLVFGLTRFTFDKGGFAAFIMLSGITVNAGIYLVSEWNFFRHIENPVRRFVKAFRYKIRPIILTIFSTVLGLVPFLVDGPFEVFWFAFAVGTVSGLAFSIIALVFYLPVFLTGKHKTMPGIASSNRSRPSGILP